MTPVPRHRVPCQRGRLTSRSSTPRLVAERQHLGAELSVAATADYQDLDQEPEEVVGEE